MSLSRFLAAQLSSRPWRPVIAGCLSMTLWSGCQATHTTRSKAVTMVADRSTGNDDESEKKDGDWNIKGPTERLLNGKRWQQQKETAIAQGNAAAIDGLPEYQAAEELFNAGNYREAEKAFKALAKERRQTYETFQVKWDRWLGIKNAAKWDPYSNFGDPIEEDSLYMLAESQFNQKRYSHAQDSYDDLLNRYPSTRHMDDVTRKLFRIARYWLNFDEDVNDKGELQQIADDEQRRKEQLKPVRGKSSITPNLFDRSRPVFDTDGRALQALRSIWLHDTTGPLADDALMLSANYHLRTGDFTESARLYKLLREQYPDSQHFEDAFLLGSHVTLASYQGPAYDGKTLNEAIKLKESALRIFPDLSDEQRERLSAELRRMYDADVERHWNKVEFYQAKNSPKSVELYCNLLINKFPESPYAEKCRKVLAEQQRNERAQARATSWLPGGNKPAPAPATPPEKPRDIESAPAKETPQEPEAKPAQPKEPRRFQFSNPLRRAPKEPELQPPAEEQYSPRPVAPASGTASLDDE